MAQIQFQMDVWNVEITDCVVYFQTSSKLKIWRIHRSPQYIQWMKEKITIFLDHVEKRTPLAQPTIPYLYFELVRMLENDKNYSVPSNSMFSLQQFPPEVPYNVIKEVGVTKQDLDSMKQAPERDKAILSPRMRSLRSFLRKLAMLLLVLVLFLSFIPVVKEG
eukprot:TRINITY_DN2126_c0_g2_i22.p1 TRINITY_DN2126_c0_g2~~TRINITY_DN2126_c0_g2_i22.p1  ORF type:complete len:163 (+),score=25.25 TRINITY_DN2126_c0_g2_i22:555-1043(+)